MLEVNPESYIPKRELYRAYCEYCRQNKLPMVSDNTFHKKLQRHVRVEDYRPKIGDKRVTAWKGITLKGAWADQATQTELASKKSAVVCGNCIHHQKYHCELLPEDYTVESDSQRAGRCKYFEPKSEGPTTAHVSPFEQVGLVGSDISMDEFSEPLHPETFEHFDIQQAGAITYYTCKHCRFRVISEYDAYWHWRVCLEHPEWQEEYKQRGAERKALLSSLLELVVSD
jgi:hypothetical protein